MGKTKLILSLVLFLSAAHLTLAQDGKGRLHVFDGHTVPDDPNILFYIQKNTNPNTIVYALLLNQAGKIDSKNPIEVFWRRYQEDGRKKKLGWLEKTFAFDFKVKKLSKPNTYMFTLVAMKKKQLIASQDKNGNPMVLTQINGKTAYLDRIYLMVDDTKRIQEVLSMELFGRDLKTGKLVYEKIEK